MQPRLLKPGANPTQKIGRDVMKITNNTGLPEAIVRAVANDDYVRDDADFTVTELLLPPRILALRREHGPELTEDAGDRIWSLLGQCAHLILARAAQGTPMLAEERLKATVANNVISGQLDHFDIDVAVLSDYKVTSVWKVKDGVPDEWEQQLNCYAYLLRANGHEVHAIQIVAILRDWSKLERLRSGGDYPKSQVKVMPVLLWDQDRQESFIAERAGFHNAVLVGNAPAPVCSPEERWARPDKWAVCKPGVKRALKLFDNCPDAETFAASKSGYTVVHRPGDNIRCKAYCAVSEFCDWWQTNNPNPGG